MRLPHNYLVDQLPEVLSASCGPIDMRESVKQHIQGCEPGVEILDSIVYTFIELLEHETISTNDDDHYGSVPASKEDSRRTTVIVWLHHLLNTNKRKQALNPTSPDVSGLTKPGYPGVLIYSGPTNDVREHVNGLRQLNWQAFSVRFESDEEWSFAHGNGVKEFESMKEVVIQVGDERKSSFMEAMRMK